MALRSKELFDAARVALAEEPAVIRMRQKREQQRLRRISDIEDELARPSQEGVEWEERRPKLISELDRLKAASRVKS